MHRIAGVRYVCLLLTANTGYLNDIPISLLHELEAVDGFDKTAFLAAHSAAPPVSIRVNPAKDLGQFVGNERVAWNSNGFYLSVRPVFTLDPLFHAGAYYVQEASSMFLEHILGHIIKDKKELRILDLCAAPGGKSTLIASMLDADSLLIANEVIRPRASILEENLTRWGHMNTWVTSNDPRDFGRLTGYFDVVVVDAPCSGSGLFRKDKHAVDEWSEANVAMCSQRQQRILADVWPSLKEGGVIVYATCSFSLQEDEQILDWFAETFSVASVEASPPPEWGIVTVTSAKNMTGYRFFPDKVKGEGFFIAAVQKLDEQQGLRPQRFKSAHDKRIKEQAGYLLQSEHLVFVPTGKEGHSVMLPAHEADLQVVSKAVYLRKTGLNIGAPAGKDWIPAHEVALSIDANRGLPSLNVTREQALRFLKREDMALNEVAKGWLMIKYNGLGLGWVKSLGNRLNNYLPKQLRIRMDIEE